MAKIYTTLASDTFHRANENPVNPAVWSADPGNSIPACQIVSDELEPTAGESIAVAYGTNAQAWPVNQWAQFQVDACVSNSDSDFASALLVMYRGTGANNGLIFEVDGPLGATCGVTIFADVNGTPTFYLGSGTVDATIALFAGDSIRMEYFEGKLSAYTIHGGVKTQVLAPVTVAVPTIGTGLYAGTVGIDLFETSVSPLPSDVQVSNFSGGLITAGSSGSGHGPNVFGTEDYGPGIKSSKTSIMGTNGRTRIVG
jgi:hypothetical protein